MDIIAPQTVHDIDTDAYSAAISHVVGDIVHVEQPVHEIAADAKLRVRSLRIAPGGEETSLKAMESIFLLLAEVASAEQPLLALNRRLLAMTVVSERESAM